MTRTIRTLRNTIREARDAYDRLSGSDELDEAATEDYENQIEDGTENIKQQIAKLNEADSKGRRSEMIRDIYTIAIPAIVDLTDSALWLRAFGPKGLHRYASLQEIVRLLKIIVALCTKARDWKIRPPTSPPIVKPTSGTIFPCTRFMIKAFDQQLHVLYRESKVRANARATARRQREVQQKQIQSSNKAARRVHQSVRDREEEEDFDEDNPAASVREYDGLVASPPKGPQRNIKSNEWTKSMNMALIASLGNQATKHLPSKT